MNWKHKIAAFMSLPVFLQASLAMSCTAAKIESKKTAVLSEDTTAFMKLGKISILLKILTLPMKLSIM